MPDKRIWESVPLILLVVSLLGVLIYASFSKTLTINDIQTEWATTTPNGY